jgi:photosystem II stability/assembly factor-like uncharacterized protein
MKNFSALCFLLVYPALGLAQSPAPPEALNDAELTSVSFVDADNGWAVGDRGVIWRTIDGGRNWQQQDSHTTVRLESVCFTDAETGWAVGGSHHPYTHQGIGVVLRTVDGGAKWQPVPDTNLPALIRVKFFGPRQGIAIGESSPLYPGGVFMTVDSGHTWSTFMLQSGLPGTKPDSPPLPDGPIAADWVTGDFAHLQGGTVAAADGRLARVFSLNLETSHESVTGQRHPHNLRLARNGTAWLCGERALLLCSKSGGSWAAPAYLPQAAAGHFDFQALATLGQHVWVAGNPGTVMFHSPDNGETWETQRTGCATALNELQFVDENRGWAVGSLGTILYTSDGGRTWRSQRHGGTRAAIMAIFSEPGSVPHEMLAQQAGQEGYLTAVEILTRPDDTSPTRTREAMTTLLATHTNTAWQFPVPKLQAHSSLEKLLSSWSRGPDDDVLARLEEYLVRRIRTWRPEVIVTEDAHPHGDRPLAQLTNQLVLTATQKAADPAAYREQIEQAGLEEWKVKKVFATLTTTGKQGDIKLICSQLASRLGASLGDIADEACGQLDDTYRLPPAARNFALLIDQLPQGQGRRDFCSGIGMPPGSETRRRLSSPPVPDFTSLSKQIQKRQVLQALLERSEQEPLRGQAWLAQVLEMTRGLSPTASGRIMYHLAQRYQASGESELAAEVMNTLVEKNPDHPLSDAALLWLIRYNASAEQAHIIGKQPKVVQPAVAKSDAFPAVKPAGGNASPPTRVAPAAALSAGPASLEARVERAITLGKLLEKSRPVLAADPGARFTLVNARTRSAAASLERERILQSLAASKSNGDWAACAKTELFIGNNEQFVCPKRTLHCQAVSTKPKLDGRLDEAFWQSARSASLRESEEPGEPLETLETLVAIAHDAEFLYLAISCQRASGIDYPCENRVRSRDADLRANDRVEVLLDIDRDFATYYRFAVDHRGWTSESCFGDTKWNPSWYVAASGDESHWTIEAAIPLAELCDEAPPEKSYWAIGLQRVVPGVQLQSWTPHADLDIRSEAFGLLQWE